MSIAAHLLTAISLIGLCASCGADAERRYAGLSQIEQTVAEAGYRLRYLAPPWQRLTSDPLVTGARGAVPVGAATREIVPGSATVLAIERQSNIEGASELEYAKYRLEAVVMRCAGQELIAGESCAAWLADSDQEGRRAREESDLFGSAARSGTNDAGQRFFELMTRDRQSQRHRRIAYFETGAAGAAVRLYIEGNPDLNDDEVSQLIEALEILEGTP